MNLNATSASSGSSALWSLLAARQASRSNGSSSSASSDAGSTDTQGASARPGPPPPPSGFDLSSMGTMQFAAMGQAPQDPIASLDSDDDGSVSADEFGLDGASDDVKALFEAIDSDGSGALLSDEIDSFREQMTSSAEAAGGHPDGPPPGGGQGGGSMDVSAFLQELAGRYAAMQADGGTGSTRLNASA